MEKKGSSLNNGSQTNYGDSQLFSIASYLINGSQNVPNRQKGFKSKANDSNNFRNSFYNEKQLLNEFAIQEQADEYLHDLNFQKKKRVLREMLSIDQVKKYKQELNANSKIKLQRFDYGDNLFGGNLVQLKGGAVRSKKLNQCESPYAGTWLKRKEFGQLGENDNKNQKSRNDDVFEKFNTENDISTKSTVIGTVFQKNRSTNAGTSHQLRRSPKFNEDGDSDDTAPAGNRNPVSYKLTYTEKLPDLIKNVQSPEQIRTKIREQQYKENAKNGNRSKVGVLLSSPDEKIRNSAEKYSEAVQQRILLDRDKYVRKIKERQVQHFNQQQKIKNDLLRSQERSQSLKQEFAPNRSLNSSYDASINLVGSLDLAGQNENIAIHDTNGYQTHNVKKNDYVLNPILALNSVAQAIYSTGSNPQSFKASDRYVTSYAQNFIKRAKRKITQDSSSNFSKLIEQDDKIEKQHFKRKSTYQQWFDAYYNHGVHFNPPVNGL